MECASCYSKDKTHGVECPYCHTFLCDECWVLYTVDEKQSRCSFCRQVIKDIAEVEKPWKALVKSDDINKQLKKLRGNYRQIQEFARALSASLCEYKDVRTSSILLYLFEYMRFKFQSPLKLQLFKEEDKDYNHFEEANMLVTIPQAVRCGILVQTLTPANDEFKEKYIQLIEESFYPFKRMNEARFAELLIEQGINIDTIAPAVEPETLWRSDVLRDIMKNRIKEELAPLPEAIREFSYFEDHYQHVCSKCRQSTEKAYVADYSCYCHNCAPEDACEITDENYCLLCREVDTLVTFDYIKPVFDIKLVRKHNLELSEHAYYCTACHRAYYRSVQHRTMFASFRSNLLSLHYIDPPAQYIPEISAYQLLDCKHKTIAQHLLFEAEHIDAKCKRTPEMIAKRKHTLEMIAKLYAETPDVTDSFDGTIDMLLQRDLDDVIDDAFETEISLSDKITILKNIKIEKLRIYIQDVIDGLKNDDEVLEQSIQEICDLGKSLK